MASSSAKMRHVVVTGPPGVGKTTLINRACQILQQKGVPMVGFYTEEQRERGRRIGFDVVTLDGQRGTLARTGDGVHLGSRHGCYVGQYAVQVEDFEKVALPVLAQPSDMSKKPVFVIDEIGKMELFSQNFMRVVSEILASPQSTLLVTIPTKRQNPIRFVEEIRRRNDVKLFEISKDNRNSVLGDIAEAVELAYKGRG